MSENKDNEENFNPVLRDSDATIKTTISSATNYPTPAPAVNHGGNGIRLEVRNLCYSISEDKALLNNVSFCLETCNMCALMGPSGAGKSTLLDLIAGRKAIGFWSGDILLNGLIGRDTAYVLQDDLHFPTLTVYETISYSAETRMPFMDGADRFAQVAERTEFLLAATGLERLRDKAISSLSGGQKKRVSVAVEIVSLPKLIFLDEPTSGLDSSISLELMSMVKNLTKDHRSVLCTIHQPSPQVFQLFDKVLLMGKGGRMIYYGSVSDVTKYFNTLGYICPKGENPAEYILEVAEKKVMPKPGVDELTTEEMEANYKKSRWNNSLPKTPMNPYVAPASASMYAVGIFYSLVMLIDRTWKTTIRDRAERKAQLVRSIVVGLLLGVSFYQSCNTASQFNSSAINESNLLYFSISYTILGSTEAIPFLAGILKIYSREEKAYAYQPFAFWLSQVLICLPILLLNHFIFLSIVYLMLGFTFTASFYFYYLFITWMINVTTHYLAMVLIVGTRSEQVALTIFPMLFLFVSTFSGFAISVDNIPVWWRWATYITYARWAFEGLMVNQWASYSTVPETPGQKTQLEIYDFQRWNAGTSIWIGILYSVLMAIMVYINLKPRRSLLKRVANATTVDKEIIETTMRESILGDALRDSIQLIVRDSMVSGISNPQNDSRNYEPFKKLAIPGIQRFRRDRDDREDPKEDTGYASRDVSYFERKTETMEDLKKTQGVNITFMDLRYSVKSSVLGESGTVELLKGIDGSLSPGDMCALMGASGAGKSTLLDVLAGRKTGGSITGALLFNGLPRTLDTRKRTAYVMQDDVHIGILTVKENLYYAAQLRLGEKFEDIDKRVDEISEMLGLTEVLDTVTGTETIRGVSGGQLKRLSIGVEIVTLPDIVFLDEPTTGLDSSISFEVMSAVKNLTNMSRTVISTIHQPSTRTFYLFNKLLLMAAGRVIYFGPTESAVNYFESMSPHNFSYVQDINPADFVVSVAGGFLPNKSGTTVSGDELADIYDKSDNHSDVREVVSRIVSKSVGLEVNPEDNKAGSQYNSSTFHQIKTLFRRSILRTVKTKKLLIVAFVKHVIIGLFYGSIFYNVTSQNDIKILYKDVLSLFFFTQLFLITGHQQTIAEVQDDRLVFYRERGASCYGALPYWLSGLLVQVPPVVINVLIFCGIVYNLAGLTGRSGAFGYFYYFQLMTSLIGMFVCQSISAISGSTQSAFSIYPVTLFFVAAYCGFIVSLLDLPYWLAAWAPYVSFMRYSFEGLTLNQFQDPSDFNFLSSLGFEGWVDQTQCCYVLAIFLIFFALMLLAAYRFVNFEKR